MVCFSILGLFGRPHYENKVLYNCIIYSAESNCITYDPNILGFHRLLLGRSQSNMCTDSLEKICFYPSTRVKRRVLIARPSAHPLPHRRWHFNSSWPPSEVKSSKCKVRGAKCKVQSAKCQMQSATTKTGRCAMVISWSWSSYFQFRFLVDNTHSTARRKEKNQKKNKEKGKGTKLLAAR